MICVLEQNILNSIKVYRLELNYTNKKHNKLALYVYCYIQPVFSASGFAQT